MNNDLKSVTMSQEAYGAAGFECVQRIGITIVGSEDDGSYVVVNTEEWSFDSYEDWKNMGKDIFKTHFKDYL